MLEECGSGAEGGLSDYMKGGIGMLQANSKDRVANRYLDGRYAAVYRYRGYPICTLKVAVPSEGDSLGYVIDDTEFCGMEFDSIETTMEAIDRLTT